MTTTDTITTPAKELRAAAAKIRSTAGKATPGPWQRAADAHPDSTKYYGANYIANWDAEYLDSVAEAGDGEQADHDAAWIALAHPGLAEPLAEWLENAAYWATRPPGANRYALAVARAINGTSA